MARGKPASGHSPQWSDRRRSWALGGRHDFKLTHYRNRPCLDVTCVLDHGTLASSRHPESDGSRRRLTMRPPPIEGCQRAVRCKADETPALARSCTSWSGTVNRITEAIGNWQMTADDFFLLLVAFGGFFVLALVLWTFARVADRKQDGGRRPDSRPDVGWPNASNGHGRSEAAQLGRAHDILRHSTGWTATRVVASRI